MYKLTEIQKTFQQCLRDIAVFERFNSDGQFFESNDFQKKNKRWLVVAAGLEESEADELFSGNPKRAQKSLAPLRYRNACKISLLFIIRPYEEDLRDLKQTLFVSPFAANRGIPYVEILLGYIRIFDIPENNCRLSNLRWEWDAQSSLKEPIERWINCWKSECGFNPAHPPSHLHLNSEVFVSGRGKTIRASDLEGELRLAIGRPNPLAFLLSFAAWVRRLG